MNRFTRAPTLACFLSILLSAPYFSSAAPQPALFAQTGMPCHPMEMQDELPPTELPVPQTMTGIGNSHMQITATPEAQMWFNQGLNLLHDFWDYESARAFEQSIRIDPDCAICYWGLYQAESFYHSIAKGYAQQALDKAVTLKAHASDRERLYIEASAAPASDAINIWRKLVHQYPDDVQAKLFLSQSVSSPERVEILQSILRENPSDSAANHYHIHALEGSGHPEKALHSAEILASLAPASGHMVHMPGHIFFRTGDYARAELAFTASMQVDERYMQEQHVAPDNDWNYVHNLMYAVANLMEEGKMRQATTLSARLTAARGKLESTLYVYSARDSITRLNPALPVALRTADWARVLELLNTAALPAGQPNLDLLERQLACFAAGIQAIENRDIPKARESSARFDAGIARANDSTGKQMHSAHPSSGEAPKLQVNPDALLQPLLSSLSIMSLELRAALSAAQANKAEAENLFQQAAHEEKNLGYHEPPGYIRPVGETAGAAMTAAGDWAAAKAAYEQALLERPRSGFALYGIALLSEKSGDPAALNDYAAFLAAWKNADPDLPQVTHAQQYLAAHRVVSPTR